MNVVILTGNLGADPEVRFLPSGTQTARLRLAVNEYWYDKNTRERQQRTHWFTVNAWARQAETCQKYLRRGSKIIVRGTLEYREWNDRDGKKRSVVEVRMQEMEMLDRRDDRGSGGGRGGYDGGGYGGQPQSSESLPSDDGFDPTTSPEEDDIPF